MSKDVNKKIAAALLVVAVILLVAAIAQYCIYAKTIKQCTELTTGTITSVNKEISNMHGGRRKNKIRHRYAYQASFQVDDEFYTATGKSGSEVYKKDDTASVYYAPGDPDKCYIDKCPPDKGFRCLCYAGCFLILGVGLFIKSR